MGDLVLLDDVPKKGKDQSTSRMQLIAFLTSLVILFVVGGVYYKGHHLLAVLLVVLVMVSLRYFRKARCT
jgi:Flp pilus assembly protein TadB